MSLSLRFTLVCAALLAIANCYGQGHDIQWQTCLGGSDNDFGYKVCVTADSGYLVVGDTKSNDGTVIGQHGGYDVWLTKLSASGALQWQNTFGGTGVDVAFDVKRTNDGGYIVCGASSTADGDVTSNKGGYDLWVIKLFAWGDIEWEHSFGGTDDEYAYSVEQTSDSGYIVAGRTGSDDDDVTGAHGGDDMWLLKLNAAGNLQWQRTLGGHEDDVAMQVLQTHDGGYFVAGYTFSNNGDVTLNRGACDVWVIKLSSSGATQWQKTFGGSGTDFAQGAALCGDDGFIVVGGANSMNGNIVSPVGGGDVWILKISAEGLLQWQRSYGSFEQDAANSVVPTADGGYLVGAYVTGGNHNVTGFHGTDDGWVLKISGSGEFEWEKALGGLAQDNIWYVHPAPDGGYIAAGYTYSTNGDITWQHGLVDYWVVKLREVPVSTTNIKEVEGAVFPNPAGDEVTVRGVLQGHVDVYDVQGRKVAASATPQHVSLAGLAAGVYCLHITGEDQQTICRTTIVKQ